jgi:hypothetical protein
MSLSFHVRHEVTAERLARILQAFSRGTAYEHITQFKRQLGRLRKLNLIQGVGSEVELTSSGHALMKLTKEKPQLLPDLLHYDHYVKWDKDEPLENAFSWTYRAFCDYLVRQGEFKLTSSNLEVVVTELDGSIWESAHFSDFVETNTQKGDVSLSTDSFSGILHILEALQPPVIDNRTFTRRHFCPPEMLALALGWVAQETGGQLGIDLLLTPERRELLCRVCLLDPMALDRALDWMLPLYPEVIEPGTRTGAYGRFVRLKKYPELQDLVT